MENCRYMNITGVSRYPHHGTQGHYFDFSQYEPENMLISNGIHFANSKKESKELRTSPLYGGLFYIPDTHMYCSNCDCCDSYENGCSCKGGGCYISSLLQGYIKRYILLEFGCRSYSLI